MPTKYEIVLGGPFAFERGWSGTITRVEPSRLVQFNRDAESESAYLRFEMQAIPGGSWFKLTDKLGPRVDPASLFGNDTPESEVYQPGGIGTHWSGVVAGYHGFVDALESHVTGKDVPYDHDEMCRRYSKRIEQWHAA